MDMAETTDQSVAEVFDDVLKNYSDHVVDAHISFPSLTRYSPSPLQNHRVANDGGRRVVYIIADIRPQDLNINNVVEPTEKIRKWISEDGYPFDEPGLLVPAEFGGTADPFNIIPWRKLMDTTALDKDKQEVREYLSGEQSSRHARLEFAFKYIENAVKFYRPSWIYYRFSLYEDNSLVKQLSNKLTN